MRSKLNCRANFWAARGEGVWFGHGSTSLRVPLLPSPPFRSLPFQIPVWTLTLCATSAPSPFTPWCVCSPLQARPRHPILPPLALKPESRKCSNPSRRPSCGCCNPTGLVPCRRALPPAWPMLRRPPRGPRPPNVWCSTTWSATTPSPLSFLALCLCTPISAPALTGAWGSPIKISLVAQAPREACLGCLGGIHMFQMVCLRKETQGHMFVHICVGFVCVSMCVLW